MLQRRELPEMLGSAQACTARGRGTRGNVLSPLLLQLPAQRQEPTPRDGTGPPPPIPYHPKSFRTSDRSTTCSTITPLARVHYCASRHGAGAGSRKSTAGWLELADSAPLESSCDSSESH